MRKPVIIGVGQHVVKTFDQSNLGSALDLAEQAARNAIHDSSANGDLVAAIDAIAWVRTFSDSAPQFKSQFGFSNNPPRSLANRLGADPEHVVHSKAGGNVPQELVNEMGARIASGEIEVALLSGGEAIANEVYAMKNGLKPEWGEEVDEQGDDRGLGLEALATSHEIAHGVFNFAPLTYSLFENVARNQEGNTLKDHRRVMADLMQPFVETAKNNKFAMFDDLPDYEQLLSQDDKVTSLYNKHFCAKEKVNQAAAVILASEEKARELGVDESLWIYPVAGSEATERTILSRRNLAGSDALEIAGKHLFKHLNLQPQEIGYVDFYSCFPSAVNAASSALSISAGKGLSLTLTGGLPYFGGPGNNYSMHAIAEMVCALRQDTSALGLISANGGILSKHALGVYSAKAPEQPFTVIRGEAIQGELDRLPSPKMAGLVSGDAHIETCAVSYSRGEVLQGLVLARMSEDGRRCIAIVEKSDDETIKLLESDTAIGIPGYISPRDGLNYFTVTSKT